MRYQVNISGRNLALTEHQMEILITAVADAEQLGETYVGSGKGTQGHGKHYLPSLEVKHPHEWLIANPISDEFMESTRLVMKLNKDSE